MRTITRLAATVTATAAVLATAGTANAATPLLSAPAAAYVGSQYVTLTATDAVSFTTSNAAWNPTSATGGCAAHLVLTVTNGVKAQHVEGACTSPGTLTGWLTYSDYVDTFTVSDGTSFTLQASYVPPTITPTPYASWTETVLSTTPYTVLVTSTGSLPLTSYVNTTHTPAALADITAPAFTSCSWRYIVIRRVSHKTTGFVCSGANLTAGQETVVTVTS